MKLHDTIKLGTPALLLNNIENFVKMGKRWAQKWHFDNQIYLLTADQCHHLEAVDKKENKLLKRFKSNCQKGSKKYLILPLNSDLLTWKKITFILIQLNPSFGSSSVPSLRSFMPK